MNSELKDGESARYRWPEQVANDMFVCGWVNSKNSFGGYSGYFPFVAAVVKSHVGIIIKISTSDDESSTVRTTCQDDGINIDSIP